MWVKENTIKNRSSNRKEEFKKLNERLSIHSKIIKYFDKNNKKPNEYIFKCINTDSKSFCLLSKILWGEGIYKKFMNNEFIIIEGNENITKILFRAGSKKLSRDCLYYLNEVTRFNGRKKLILIMGQKNNLESGYFNNCWLAGVNKKRTQIYGTKHNLVTNTPGQLVV